MELHGVGIEQLAKLADAMVAADLASQTIGSPPPRCFGLVGTLGAGKTRFCQEIARAWGIDSTEVTSPTFTLVKSYQIGAVDPVDAEMSLHHLDLYRVADEDELWELGLDELWETPASWTLVEWADRFIQCLPKDTIWIHIDIDESGAAETEGNAAPARTIRLSALTAEQSLWLSQVRSKLTF